MRRRRLRIGRGIGHGFLLYRLGRFAFSRPYWHPLVSIAVLAVVAVAVVTGTRKGNGPRR